MSSNCKSRPYKGNSLMEFPNSFVVIDIETTGRSSDFDSIIELAALKVEKGIIIDSYQELVNPGFDVDGFIEALTGITNEMLAGKKTIEEVLPGFLKFVGKDCIIVGHNVSFDINFIYDRSVYYYDTPISNDFVDTLRLSKRVLTELDHHRLCDLVEHYNIQVETQHRALADCYSTFEVLQCLKNTVEEQYEDVESFFESNKRKKGICCRDIDFSVIPNIDSIDESHPLYNKHCCFTGALEKYSRTQASQIVVNFGGICDNSVTKNTNYLILGNNDYCSTVKDGKSTKHKKAEELILKGFDLIILPETAFYEMIELDNCKKTIAIKGLVQPKGTYETFESVSDKLDFLKKTGLISQEAKELKQFFYKGLYSEDYCICELIGYESMSSLVISIDNHLHCINTDCFKEMQPLIKDSIKYINNIPTYCEE